jgi:hypothetical protein
VCHALVLPRDLCVSFRSRSRASAVLSHLPRGVVVAVGGVGAVGAAVVAVFAVLSFPLVLVLGP